ncbi:MAG: hypothetical protein AB1716_20875 [Planctomycetota bacterium]
MTALYLVIGHFAGPFPLPWQLVFVLGGGFLLGLALAWVSTGQ